MTKTGAHFRPAPGNNDLAALPFLGLITRSRLPETAFKELDPVIVAKYLPAAAPSTVGSISPARRQSGAKSANPVR